jgi:hypothetical protein
MGRSKAIAANSDPPAFFRIHLSFLDASAL